MSDENKSKRYINLPGCWLLKSGLNGREHRIVMGNKLSARVCWLFVYCFLLCLRQFCSICTSCRRCINKNVQTLYWLWCFFRYPLYFVSFRFSLIKKILDFRGNIRVVQVVWVHNSTHAILRQFNFINLSPLFRWGWWNFRFFHSNQWLERWKQCVSYRLAFGSFVLNARHGTARSVWYEINHKFDYTWMTFHSLCTYRVKKMITVKCSKMMRF